MFNYLKRKWREWRDRGRHDAPALELHERYPQILDWQKDDTFESHTFYAGKAQLLAVTTEGRVFLKDYERTFDWSLAYVIKHTHNRDVQERRVTARLKNSHEYMALLADFQESVKALQRRDTERIGEPIENLLDKNVRRWPEIIDD